ncbi:MAG: hypothetical protein ACK4FB_07990 [Brevundimonas sp.]|uniref:hypothetical protein n=1 Tax=Brevundimonas sp. TaxID=1871086 RepID=UPI00391BC569
MAYCDFKPGDEVVVVAVGEVSGCFISVGQVHVVREVSLVHDEFGNPIAFDDGEKCGVKLVGIYAQRPGSVHRDGHFHPSYFRKVQRRDLSAWLETATDYEEPKVKRAPVKERVQ